jgi:RimJ/RimL family protein N-acetyltransferase
VTRENEFGQPVGDPVQWSGARTPQRITLTGQLIRLVPLEPRHAQGLLDLGAEADLWTYQGEEAPQTSAQAEAIVARMNDTADALPFAIESPTGRFLGRSVLMRIQPAVGSIEVGSIIYAPALKRSRAATEVQYLLLRYGFELGYRRYEWKCDSLNAPSRSAAARLGFTEEGTWRNALVTKGRNRDTTWFSITDHEWPSVRAALESWLDDGNFDGSGRQRKRLAEFR